MKVSIAFRYLLLFPFFMLFLSACKEDDDGTNPPVEPPQEQTTPWPEWVFHHWVWENEGTTESARQLVQDYLDRDIPVSAIIIDSPWETGYNTLEWDQNRYPNVQQLIDEFHSKNVRVLLWITNFINTDVQPLYDQLVDSNFFLQGNANSGPAVMDWWKGEGSLIDYHNPNAVRWWKKRMDPILEMGIDGWKCDGSDFYATLANYSPYLQDHITRTEHSHAYYRIHHEYTRERLGIDRAITARPVDNQDLDIGGEFFASSPLDIGWACWVGDQDGSFDGLKDALQNMYFSYELGYLAFGSDIGGFRTEDHLPLGRTKEVFIRWAQMAAFCPLMENGGGGEHRPWMFDDQTTDIYRTFVNLHEDLVPYLMEHSVTYFADTMSLMQFFNQDDYSFLLGPDIFVAPMLEEGNDIAVNFPAGNDWVYLFDKSTIYTGGASDTLSIPIDEFSVFLKEGSDLVMNLEVKR